MRNIERSTERGISDLGWLRSRFTYSFADYVNPKRMGFGALRVVNDDTIAPESGFPLHHHAQMEIVTIMLLGTLTHQDSMGNRKELRAGEVQAMTAGTGVNHSEWNNDATTPVKLLQIWVHPKERALIPSYAEARFEEGDRRGAFQVLASGVKKDGALFIHQDAVFARAQIEKGKSASYKLSDPAHGVFLFVIAGHITVGNDVLAERDTMEITNEKELQIMAEETADVLVIEVPMQ